MNNLWSERIAEIYSLFGPVGVALIFVAIAALYIALRETLYLNSVWKSFRRDFLDLERGQDRCFAVRDPKRTNPLIQIIYDIVTTHSAHSDDIRAEVGYLFYRNFKRVTNGLCWLKLIAVISPLLGLLGTVTGMLTVFQSLSDISLAQSGALASGIWSALITTVEGLVIAIPTLMTYYWLMMKFKGFHIEAIEHSYRALEVTRRLNVIPNRREATEPVHANPHNTVHESL